MFFMLLARAVKVLTVVVVGFVVGIVSRLG